MSESNTPIFPVTAWDIGPLPGLGVIVFRPSFISSPMQNIDEADTGRFYGLTIQQAHELKEALDKAINKLEESELQIPAEDIN